jgi:CMP-N-acetylneuraminic acid synthetase
VDEKIFQLIILALIPARSGSKGVPGKNKKLLGGIPLINYTIQSALDTNGMGRILATWKVPVTFYEFPC